MFEFFERCIPSCHGKTLGEYLFFAELSTNRCNLGRHKVSVELKPEFIRALGSVSGHTETVRGNIYAAWRFEEDVVRYTVTVPEHMEVTFRGKRLQAGKNEFLISDEENNI